MIIHFMADTIPQFLRNLRRFPNLAFPSSVAVLVTVPGYNIESLAPRPGDRKIQYSQLLRAPLKFLKIDSYNLSFHTSKFATSFPYLSINARLGSTSSPISKVNT